MPKKSRPRKGSLQYWPRKRAKKILPKVNWKPICFSSKNNELLGFIGYKVGMVSLYVKDKTEHSITKGKEIVVPATVIECPPIKIFSVRAYKNFKVSTEVLSGSLDKKLKSKIKLPKSKKDLKKIDDLEKNLENYDDLRVVVYSIVKKTSIKKTPDIIELGIGGKDLNEKLKKINELWNKEIAIHEVFDESELVDVRGVTKAFGTQGPVKRFGIGLKSHKSEKGRRRPGSLGPWTPTHVTFRAPQMGQTGFFSRISYNKRILKISDINKKDINPGGGWKNYGLIKNDYIILKGSVQGTKKRPLLLIKPLRITKKRQKKNLELIKIIR